MLFIYWEKKISIEKIMMTRTLKQPDDIFINHIYLKGPEKNFVPKNIHLGIDDIWSADSLDLKDCDPKKIEWYE